MAHGQLGNLVFATRVRFGGPRESGFDVHRGNRCVGNHSAGPVEDSSLNRSGNGLSESERSGKHNQGDGTEILLQTILRQISGDKAREFHFSNINWATKKLIETTPTHTNHTSH